MNDIQSEGRLIGMNKAWIYVALTSFFELVWIYGFNTANHWWHWVFIVLFIFIDFYFLTKACELLPTGTVYAIFAGVGTVGTTLMDLFLFEGTFSIGKIIFIGLVVLGVILLKLSDEPETEQHTEGTV